MRGQGPIRGVLASGDTMIWCRTRSEYSTHRLGHMLVYRCRPELKSNKVRGRMKERIEVLEDGQSTGKRRKAIGTLERKRKQGLDLKVPSGLSPLLDTAIPRSLPCSHTLMHAAMAFIYTSENGILSEPGLVHRSSFPPFSPSHPSTTRHQLFSSRVPCLCVRLSRKTLAVDAS